MEAIPHRPLGPLLTDKVRALPPRQAARTVDRWVLRDIDFAVEPGESVGIVGANGAGKSTLLKVLTGVMYPYAGSCRSAAASAR